MGKTYIIEKFGRDNYANVVVLNFMKDADLKMIFEGDLDVDSISKTMGLFLPEEKLIPTGNRICSSGTESPVTALKFEIKKSVYLK